MARKKVVYVVVFVLVCFSIGILFTLLRNNDFIGLLVSPQKNKTSFSIARTGSYIDAGHLSNNNFYMPPLTDDTFIPGLKVFAAFLGPFTLVNFTKPEKPEDPMELLFGFSLNGLDYKFKVIYVPCQIPDRPEIPPLTDVIPGKVYTHIMSIGVKENPIVSNMGGSEQCKNTWSHLQPIDTQILKSYFTKGQGFNNSVNSTVDLSTYLSIVTLKDK